MHPCKTQTLSCRCHVSTSLTACKAPTCYWLHITKTTNGNTQQATISEICRSRLCIRRWYAPGRGCIRYWVIGIGVVSRHLLPHVHKRHAWPTVRCIRPCGGPTCKSRRTIQKLLQCYRRYVVRALDMSALPTGRCLHEASPFLAPCCLHRPVMQRVRKEHAYQICVEPRKLALESQPPVGSHRSVSV